MDKKIPITDPRLDAYMLNLIPKRDRILSAMEAYAKQNDFPIIGPLVGRWLALLAMIQKPKTIVELGSGYGYSAYWLTRATDERTKIFCTDGDEKNYQLAKKYFKRAKLDHRIQYFVGDALEMIEKFKDNSVDMILNDIDKQDYPKALKKAVRKLKPGGLLITDNVLWSGRVLLRHPKEPATLAIQEFNKMIFSSKNLFSAILPLRDGLAVCIKK